MKKVLFTIGMIAILVGVAFAGMAATGKNNGVPADLSALDAKVTALQDSVSALDQKVTALTQGNITRMETRTGHVIDNQPIIPLDVYNEGYPQMRHASITLNTAGMVNGSVLQIIIDVGGWTWYAASITTNGLYVLDYDTKWVRFLATTPGPPFRVDYNITLSYAN